MFQCVNFQTEVTLLTSNNPGSNTRILNFLSTISSYAMNKTQMHLPQNTINYVILFIELHTEIKMDSLTQIKALRRIYLHTVGSFKCMRM